MYDKILKTDLRGILHMNNANKEKEVWQQPLVILSGLFMLNKTDTKYYDTLKRQESQWTP